MKLALFRLALVALLGLTALAALAQTPSAATAEQVAAAASAADRSAQAAAKSASAAASAASSAQSRTWSAPLPFWQYTIPGVVFLAALITMVSIRSSLTKTSWSLADALSEETQLTSYKVTTTTDTVGVKTEVRELEKDKDGKPMMFTELRASTSRVIALMGMMVIVFMFVGFGVFAMFSFGVTGTLPDSMDTLVKFLAAGMTLFAPYVVNKFASLFSGLSGGK